VIDCLTLWVANLLDRGWAHPDVEAEAQAVASLVAGRPAPAVAVSNEVGLGIVPASELGRRFRDVLGQVNAVWAEAAGEASLVVAGRLLKLERQRG
jgi:adenosylcobyric acid synthase